MSLIDFVTKENAELVNQHQQLLEINRVFAEIKELYDKADAELKGKSVTTKKPKEVAEPKKEDESKKIQEVKRSAEQSKETAKAHSRPEHIQIDQVIPQPTARNAKNAHYLEMEKYRQELEKQIEEKQRLKKLEEERQKAEDEALENKLAQQRLKMYLEFMDEQSRGEFINKRKNANPINKVDSLVASRPPPRPSSSSPPEEVEQQNDTADETSKASPYTNVLSNLNEVRKLIQSDHIEMVERLLNLNVN